VINEIGVWELIPRPWNQPVLKRQWVDVDKGTAGKPNYRSRRVAKELKLGPRSRTVTEYFASMPPLASLKFLLILATSESFPDADGKFTTRQEQPVLGFINIRRAHFVSAATRDLLIELLPEAQKAGNNQVAHLLKSLYGTRDAGYNWDKEKVRVWVGILGFGQDPGLPSNFYHLRRNLRITVHGDDFVTLGPLTEVRKFQLDIQKHWKCRENAVFAPPGAEGTMQEIKHLNRTLKKTSEGIVYEPDVRHVEIVLQAIGAIGSKVTDQT
jgi:hypothetical protein